MQGGRSIKDPHTHAHVWSHPCTCTCLHTCKKGGGMGQAAGTWLQAAPAGVGHPAHHLQPHLRPAPQAGASGLRCRNERQGCNALHVGPSADPRFNALALQPCFGRSICRARVFAPPAPYKAGGLALTATTSKGWSGSESAATPTLRTCGMTTPSSTGKRNGLWTGCRQAARAPHQEMPGPCSKLLTTN